MCAFSQSELCFLTPVLACLLFYFAAAHAQVWNCAEELQTIMAKLSKSPPLGGAVLDSVV